MNINIIIVIIIITVIVTMIIVKIGAGVLNYFDRFLGLLNLVLHLLSPIPHLNAPLFDFQKCFEQLDLLLLARLQLLRCLLSMGSCLEAFEPEEVKELRLRQSVWGEAGRDRLLGFRAFGLGRRGSAGSVIGICRVHPTKSHNPVSSKGNTSGKESHW